MARLGRAAIIVGLGAYAFQDVLNSIQARSLVVCGNGPTRIEAGLLIGTPLDAGCSCAKSRYDRKEM